MAAALVLAPIAEEKPAWFAAHTRSRFEKQVARQLAERRVEAFLPMREEMHRWRDRWQKVEVPLFSGYVFVQYAATQQRIAVLRTPGVVRIVGFGLQDEPVPDEQIESLRRILGAGAPVHRHRALRIGQRVRVISGPFAGVEGSLARVKKQERLVIHISAIRQAVTVEISGYDILPL